MSKKIITISREFGSGGRYIGEEVANKLGIKCYDREIIIKTAEKTGLAEKYIEKMGEYSPNKSIFSYAFVGRGRDGSSIEDMMYSVQREVILELADQEPCVIVGRCADYILKDRDDCIHEFICGNEKEKEKRIRRLYRKSGDETIKMMKEIDRKRSINHRYYTDQVWGMSKNYTISLNSSEIGYEKCIEILADLCVM